MPNSNPVLLNSFSFGRCPSGNRVHFRGGAGQSGFTLMEVLVASAIMGICLGVLVSGISNGYRQSARGALARRAASVAQEILHMTETAGDLSYSDSEGEVERYPGWNYRIEYHEMTVSASVKGAEEPAVLDDTGLLEQVITIDPPGSSPPFRITSWIRAKP